MKETVEKKKPSGRLLALDILRGITIAGMILVNNPGSWSNIYAPLKHAEWNGLTPTDLVFPFFMFIMGISTYFSLRKFNFEWSWHVGWKILRRTVVIFAIGIGIAWLSLFMRGIMSEATLWEAICNFDHIRFLGVMPRLALCYGVASVVALSLKHKYLPGFIISVLAVYAIVLLMGCGFEFADHNVISIVDHKVLGPNHMYADTVGGVTLKFDPEGLLSTIPSIAHVLIGVWCGMLIMSTKENTLRINKLFIVGTILTFAGFLLSYGMPINKKVWSPTFVLTTCGLASSFLGLLIWIIDIRGKKQWCRFFEAFGINPLFMYVLGSVGSIFLGTIKVGDTTVKGWLYNDVWMPVAAGDATLASLLFALTYVIFIWIFGYILYKKKIYIKI